MYGLRSAAKKSDHASYTLTLLIMISSCKKVRAQSLIR